MEGRGKGKNIRGNSAKIIINVSLQLLVRRYAAEEEKYLIHSYNPKLLGFYYIIY